MMPRAVAQLGSALDWGSRGRRFKSCQPDVKAQVRVGFSPGLHHVRGSFSVVPLWSPRRCRGQSPVDEGTAPTPSPVDKGTKRGPERLREHPQGSERITGPWSRGCYAGCACVVRRRRGRRWPARRRRRGGGRRGEGSREWSPSRRGRGCLRCHSVVATVLGGRGVACGAQDADGDGSGGDLHGSEGGVVGAQDRQAPRSLSVGDLAGDPAELDEDARVQDGYR